MRLSYKRQVDDQLRLTMMIELFLPSYANRDAQDLEHKQDPVEDIILTDEEADAMLPQ